jgi:uncharacterized damage-inducible protein DinB
MLDALGHLQRLVEHLDWADKRVLSALRSARNASPAAFRLYSHVLGAEHAWLARISGRGPGVAVWPDLSLDECEQLARENALELARVVDAMTAADRAKPIVYRNTSGKEFTTALEDILLHVALHGAYHRGQVAALLREGGDEPQATDYIVFTREGY